MQWELIDLYVVLVKTVQMKKFSQALHENVFLPLLPAPCSLLPLSRQEISKCLTIQPAKNLMFYFQVLGNIFVQSFFL